MGGCGTFSASGGDKTQGMYGLANSHAFSWIGAWEIKNKQGVTLKLVKFRNPWSSDGSFSGSYADKNSNWDNVSDDAKAIVG
jgi:hypothetical protein